jgi:hypothetical protein
MFGEAPRPKRSLLFDQFGTPDVSGPGWSAAARRGVEEHQAAVAEELAAENERMAMEDERIAAERQREAERVADKFTRIRNPSAREKFFDENEAAMAGSKRYNQLAEIRQRQPSFADNVLANNLANKIDDPDERNVFLGAVAKGAGTLAAREEADRFRLRRSADAQLAKLGMHPQERKRILDEEGYDDAVVNYYASQNQPYSSGTDPKVSMLSKHVELLRDKVKRETDSLAREANPETVEKLRLLESALEREYEKVYSPSASPVLTQTPAAAGSETLEQKAARLRKKYNIE